jgi:hypothetical protein
MRLESVNGRFRNATACLRPSGDRRLAAPYPRQRASRAGPWIRTLPWRRKKRPDRGSGPGFLDDVRELGSQSLDLRGVCRNLDHGAAVFPKESASAHEALDARDEMIDEPSLRVPPVDLCRLDSSLPRRLMHDGMELEDALAAEVLRLSYSQLALILVGLAGLGLALALSLPTEPTHAPGLPGPDAVTFRAAA